MHFAQGMTTKDEGKTGGGPNVTPKAPPPLERPRSNKESAPMRPPATPSAPLEQVRELLFGSIQRELERRLMRAEAHLAAQASELDQESRQRSEVVESHLRKETDALNSRLEREITGTADALRSLTRDHREAFATLDQRVAKLEDAMLRSERQTRQAMLDQAKSFLEELRRVRGEILALIQQELELGEEAHDEGEERPTP